MEQLFPKYPGSSRVWIFQANKNIESSEATRIMDHIQHFLSNWKSHGKAMNASFQIVNHYFLIIALNTLEGNEASGCGIDALVQEVKIVGNHAGIDFFNNANIAFQTESGVKIVPLSEVKKDIETGKITPEQKVFVNSITTLDELNSKWLIPSKDSWLARFFKAKSILSEG